MAQDDDGPDQDPDACIDCGETGHCLCQRLAEQGRIPSRAEGIV